MATRLKKYFVAAVFILLLAGLFVFLKQPATYEALTMSLEDLRNSLLFANACNHPLTYKLGAFDSRFGISQEEFLSAVADAEKVWEDAGHRELFAYEPNGRMAVSLIYDFRQEATDKLKKLGIQIKNDEASYNIIKTKYFELLAAYNTQKTRLSAQIAAYEKRKADYENQVSKWNKQGGAPEEEYLQLQQEKDYLKAEAGRIQTRQKTLNAVVSDLNAVVDSMNLLASTLNLQVEKYNNIGTQHGNEFEAGVFESGAGGISVNIFAFGSRVELVRSLIHELGHALGMQHVENPAAIMYRLNQINNDVLTDDDRQQLRQVCNLSF